MRVFIFLFFYFFELKVFPFSAERTRVLALTDAHAHHRGLCHASIVDTNMNGDRNNVQHLAKGVARAGVGITLQLCAAKARAR